MEIDENGQIFTLEALIASLILLTSIIFVPYAITHFITENSETQLFYYSQDLLRVLSNKESYENASELERIVSDWSTDEMRTFLESFLPENVGYYVEIQWDNGSTKFLGDNVPENAVYSKIPVVIHQPSQQFIENTGIQDRSETDLYCIVEVVLILWYR